MVLLGKRPEVWVELLLFSVKNPKALRSWVAELKSAVDEISSEFPSISLRVRAFPSAYKDELFNVLKGLGLEEKEAINCVEYIWRRSE